jgi:glutathione-regulated potassium-efflux system ancillary protein KefG
METVRKTRPVLILFAHPALRKSRVNKRLIETLVDLEHITFHDLYEAYPDFDIDVNREQALLTDHEVIIFHHPFYWYSAPAILKEWQDLVLQHGWAYGNEGKALCGKLMLSVISAGGREEAYQQGGSNRYTIGELLSPFDQTAHLCGMDYLPPFVIHGTHQLTDEDIAAHARAYRSVVVALRDGRIDLEAARQYPRLNSRLDAVIAKG